MTPLPAFALIKKELITRLRTRSFFVFVLTFVSLATIGILAAWPADYEVRHNVGYFSERLFTTFKLMLFAGCILVIPGIAGTSIGAERDQEAFELLTITLVRPRGIVLAKLLNIVDVYLLLITAALPVFGCIFFLVGVDPRQFLWSVLISVTVAVSCAMVGILCSALFRRTSVSVVISYVTALIIPMGGWYILARGGLELLSVFLGDLWPRGLGDDFIPIALPMLTVLPYGIHSWQLPCAVAYQIALSAICLVITVRILHRPPKLPRAIAPKPIDDLKLLKKRRRTFPYYLVDPFGRKKLIGDRRNPMLIKELRYGLMGRFESLARWLLGSFLVFILVEVMLIASSGDWGISMMERIMAVQLACVLVVTPALVAGALSKEHELGNMDMLRMTLLSPWQIVSGKLLAGLIAVSPVLMAMALTSLPFVYEHGHVQGVGSFLCAFWVTILECVLLSLSLGLFASLVTRRTAASIGLSYGLNFMIFIGLYTICALVYWWDAEMISGYVATAFSPVVAFVRNLDDSWKSLYAGGSFFTPYWIIVTLSYAAVTCGIIWLCVTGFARYQMRERDRSVRR